MLFLFATSFVATTIAKYVKEENTATFNLTVRADVKIDLALTEGGTEASGLWKDAEHNLSIIPGVTIPFNPYVRVGAGSEPAYLFIEIAKTGSGSYTFDELITLAIDTGWKTSASLPPNVYYMEVDKKSAAQFFPIISGDTVTFMDTITEADLGSFAANGYPQISISAYAVQIANLDGVEGAKVKSPADAWDYLKG